MVQNHSNWPLGGFPRLEIHIGFSISGIGGTVGQQDPKSSLEIFEVGNGSWGKGGFTRQNPKP